EMATGRPNACNLCHLDKTLGWTADHLHEWFGQVTPELPVEQREVADSVRLALAGDAGQRALVAWHYGWAPAQKASGDSWLLPILAQLLDDPYSAIRCIAERSLRHTATSAPPGYDYTVEPSERAPIAPALLVQWSRQGDVTNIPQ